MAMPVKIGLIGGNGGTLLDIISTQLPKTLDNIEIWSSADGTNSATVINGILFCYTDTSGMQRTVGPWGTATGNSHQFNIDTGSDDYLNKIEGRIDKTQAPYDGDLGITSLTLTTKKGHTQTYGNPKHGTTFTVPLETAGIFAFFAKSGAYINALGFYAQNP